MVLGIWVDIWHVGIWLGNPCLGVGKPCIGVDTLSIWVGMGVWLGTPYIWVDTLGIWVGNPCQLCLLVGLLFLLFLHWSAAHKHGSDSQAVVRVLTHPHAQSPDSNGVGSTKAKASS